MSADVGPFANLPLCPDGWSEEHVESVAAVNPESLGVATPPSFEFRYIDISSADHGTVIWDTVTTQKFGGSPTRARRVVRPNDILMCTVRPGLKAHAFADWHERDGYVCSTGFAVLRAREDVTPRYLFHAIFSDAVSQQIRRLETGSNYPAINESDVRHLRILKPPLPEQRRIAAILDTLDAAMQQTDALIAKLKAVKAGLLHDLLTRGIDEHGQLRDPITCPDRFKDSPVGLVPTSWEVTTLGGAVARAGGILQTGPFGSQLHAHEYVTDGVPVIMPQDIINGRIMMGHIARVAPAKVGSLSRHIVQVNDVVFARRGDLSRCAAMTPNEAGWLCGTGCLLVRLPVSEIDGRWLVAIYQHDRSQRQILARAVGSTMVNLNTSLLSSLVIAMPSRQEQQAVMQRIEAHESRIRVGEAERDKLALLKKGLMHDLLTGRVRVPVDEKQEAGATRS